MKLFISYSHDDQGYVSELAAALRDDVSQHEVWLDKRLYGGQKWWNAILGQIQICECFIPILTPRNVSSIFCTAELNYAQALNKPIVPIRLKPCDIPANLKEIQYIDVIGILIEKVLRYCEKSFGDIRVEIHQGKYLLPNPLPSPPPLPEPSTTSTTLSHSNGLHSNVTINLIRAMSGLSEHTNRSYLRWINRFMSEQYKPSESKPAPEALNLGVLVPYLNPETFQQWLGKLHAKGLSKQSVDQAKASIIWLVQYLVDQGYLERQVLMSLKMLQLDHKYTSTSKPMRSLSQAEIKQFIAQVRHDASSNNILDVRNAALIFLMITCGLKRSQLVKLKWDNLVKKDEDLFLDSNGTGDKSRMIKLPTSVSAIILQWQEYHPNPSDGGAMFTRVWKGGTITTKAITAEAVWRIIKDIARKAKLTSVTPETFRRAFDSGILNSRSKAVQDWADQVTEVEAKPRANDVNHHNI